MLPLSSQQALKLAADFALAAEQMRASNEVDFHTRANLYETASRVAFLRSHAIAKGEEMRPVLGEYVRRATFAVA